MAPDERHPEYRAASDDRERTETIIRRDREEAARGLDALAKKLGAWDPVRVIREYRNSR
jgi:hypothetical protein